jgi:hypothetical protein
MGIVLGCGRSDWQYLCVLVFICVLRKSLIELPRCLHLLRRLL